MSKYHIGDYVRVLDGRNIKDHAGGGFFRGMEEYIGKVTTVRAADDDGYQLNLPGLGAHYVFDERGLELAGGSLLAKEMECEYREKPGLGCRPYWVWVPERMSQLAEAIKNCENGSYDHIELWGMEIALLAKLKEALDDVRRKKGEKK